MGVDNFANAQSVIRYVFALQARELEHESATQSPIGGGPDGIKLRSPIGGGPEGRKLRSPIGGGPEGRNARSPIGGGPDGKKVRSPIGGGPEGRKLRSPIGERAWTARRSDHRSAAVQRKFDESRH